MHRKHAAKREGWEREGEKERELLCIKIKKSELPNIFAHINEALGTVGKLRRKHIQKIDKAINRNEIRSHPRSLSEPVISRDLR